jgi:hypothetical protein
MTDDVVDKIEHDHRDVEALFDEYERSEERSVALKICDELEIHTIAEEQEVYPVIQEEVAGGEAEIREAVHEHEEAKRLIDQIRSTDGDIAPLMHELKDAVAHHVEEEESEVLPQARAELPEEELEELGEKFDEAKDAAS